MRYPTLYGCRMICLSFLFIFHLPSLIYSQKSPKVGLVLSGGGAKGYAHIGVLKVLEKAGVRVDYVGGTSMGAFVGGLYASGWSATELDSLVRNTNIRAAMQDKVSRRTKSFFEKEYGEHYALSLGFQNFQVQLPAALSNGQNLYNLLSRWTSPVNAINDFSQLPIPFLAIGTDVVTGDEIVFKSGFLPQVMRASGSFPGLLAPVWVNGQLVTDGGLVNNFPAEEVRNEGMDIVIGVTLAGGLYEGEELQSVENIITQISSYQMVKRSKEQLKHCDIVIRPDIQGFSVTSFDAVDTLITNGEKAANKYWDKLVDIAQKQGKVTQKSYYLPPARSDSFCIDTLAITEIPGYSRNNILENFPVPLTGNISLEDFYEGIENLYGKGYFQFINYRFSESEGQCKNLMLSARLKPDYDRVLRFGLHYDPVFKTSLLLNLTFRNIGIKNTTASLDLILGDKFRYNFNYFVEKNKKIDLGFNSYLRYNTINFDLPDPVQLDNGLFLSEIDFSFLDFSNEFYLHFWRNKNFAYGLAGEIKYQRVTTAQLVPTNSEQFLSTGSGFFLVGSTFLKYDNRDQRQFATSGIRMTAKARLIYPLTTGISKEEASSNIDFHIQKIFKLSARFSMGLTTDIGFTLGEASQPYYYLLGSSNQNLINNFKAFIGLPFAKAVGSDLYAASLYGQQRLFKNHYVSLSVQGAYLKSVFQPNGEPWPYYHSLGLGYGLQTAFGPVELIFGFSNVANTISFNLGHWF